MLDQWLSQLSDVITASTWIAPILALLAVVLTSFTPCALSSVPLIVGYVGGTGEKRTNKAFKLSLTFALGSAITFTILGIITKTSNLYFLSSLAVSKVLTNIFGGKDTDE